MRFLTKEVNPEQYQRYFAWFPRKIGRTWIWLEFYEATGWIDTGFDREMFFRLPPM